LDNQGSYSEDYSKWIDLRLPYEEGLCD